MQWPVVELAEWEELRQCPECGRAWLAVWPEELEGGMILAAPSRPRRTAFATSIAPRRLRAYCLARLEEHFGELRERKLDCRKVGCERKRLSWRELLRRAPHRGAFRPPPREARRGGGGDEAGAVAVLRAGVSAWPVGGGGGAGGPSGGFERGRGGARRAWAGRRRARRASGRRCGRPGGSGRRDGGGGAWARTWRQFTRLLVRTAPARRAFPACQPRRPAGPQRLGAAGSTCTDADSWGDVQRRWLGRQSLRRRERLHTETRTKKSPRASELEGLFK